MPEKEKEKERKKSNSEFPIRISNDDQLFLGALASVDLIDRRNSAPYLSTESSIEFQKSITPCLAQGGIGLQHYTPNLEL